MFKKIISNRDPEKTVWSELNNEFSPYVSKADSGFRAFISAYPKAIFFGMVGLIILSIVLSFTLFRNTNDPFLQKTSAAIDVVREPPTNDVIQGVQLLQSMLSTRKTIDDLLSKDVLSGKDSVDLENAIEQLAIIELQLNYR